MTEQTFQPCIRALLYPVQFLRDIRSGVPEVLKNVVDVGALGLTPREYLHFIRRALASTDDLSKVLTQMHSDEAIRVYLTDIAQELEARER